MPRLRWLGRDRRERERADEMQAHLDLFVDELVARGRSHEDARREARLKFGNPRVKLEEVHAMTRIPFVESLWRDVRLAFRVLRRTPAFTITAVTTLALVIGANSAVFSLADRLLLRPLPYPQPERLAYVNTTTSEPRGTYTSVGQEGAAWETVRDHVPSIDAAVFAGTGGGVNLVAGDVAIYVQQQRVSAGYFRVLGVLPRAGREFTLDEDVTGGPPVAILSHALWRRAFHGDDAILGKSVLLRGEPYTVVGVMPDGFTNLWEVEIWTPLRPSKSGEGGGTNYEIIARLKKDATPAQAEGELRAASAPEVFVSRGNSKDSTSTLGLSPMHEVLADGVRQPLVMLSAAVGVVLLIACVNLAALLLARAGSRAKEIATRMALGSGRRAIVRQLMVEAMLVALAGGFAGIFVGYVGLEGLKSLGGGTFSDWNRVTLDARVAGITLGLAALTSVIFGLVPAWQASRLDVQSALADGGSRSIAGSARHWPRRVLVVAEVALGVTLLVTAGLLLHTFVNLRRIDPGFDPSNLATGSASLQDARYGTVASVTRLFDESLSRLRREPGIESAAVSLGLPYERLLNMGFRWVGGAEAMTSNVGYVSDGFFETMKLPLRQGRTVRETDRENTPPVVVVNETFASLYSKDQPALGRRLRLSGVEREVVGIVGDAKQASSGFFVTGMTRGPIASKPTIYLPVAQTNDGMLRMVHTWFKPVWSVRSRATAQASVAIREALTSTDALLPVAESRTMDAVMARPIAQQRLLMILVGVVAGVAILLSAIGLHGLIAHAVAERRREFGIRLALGATPGGTVRQVAISGLTLAAIGAVGGGLLSLVAARLVESFVWPAGTTDPLTYAGVAVVFLLVAIVASILPALSILRLDPAQTLRT